MQDKGILEERVPTCQLRRWGCIHDHLRGSCICEKLGFELEEFAELENYNKVLAKMKEWGPEEHEGIEIHKGFPQQKTRVRPLKHLEGF